MKEAWVAGVWGGLRVRVMVKFGLEENGKYGVGSLR